MIKLIYREPDGTYTALVELDAKRSIMMVQHGEIIVEGEEK